MAILRTFIGGTLFLILLGLIFWVVFSNAEPRLPLKFAGLNAVKEGVPNPFASVSGTPLMWPFSAWLMVFALIGTVFGLVIGWFLGGGTRVRARQQGRRARQAEKDLKAVKAESETAKMQADTLKGENKDLESKVKVAEALAAPSEVKQLISTES